MEEVSELLKLESFETYEQVGKAIGIVFGRANMNKSRKVKNLKMTMLNDILKADSWADLKDEVFSTFEQQNKYLYTEDKELPLLGKAITWLDEHKEEEFNDDILRLVLAYFLQY